jgi:hypothetical protein
MNPIAATASSPLGQEYRLERKGFWIGVWCAAFFALVGVASVWMALTNSDGSFARPIPFAIVSGTFFGLLTLLGLHLLRAYHVERLLLWEDRVKVIGSFRTREVKFAEVERAEWRLHWSVGGSLALHTGAVRVVIHFSNYGYAGARIRDYLHVAIPLERQECWDMYSMANMPPTPEMHERVQRQARWVIDQLALVGVVLLWLGITDVYNDPAMRWVSIVCGVVTGMFYLFARQSG